MRVAGLIAGLLVITLAGAAYADGNPHVARAATAWRELEYELVLDASEAALADPSLAAADRLEALRLLGSALVVLERGPEAEAAFARIFVIDPDYVLPAGTSPRVRAVFEPARARWQVEEQERLANQFGSQLAALTLRLELPRAPRGGRPVVIGVELADPSGLASTIVFAHRRSGASYYTLAKVPARSGRSALTLAGELTASPTPYTLEVHVHVLHRSGVILRRAGEAARPIQLGIAAGQVPTATPITRRWWFWASIGVVAVGTGLLVREAVDAGAQDVVLR